MSMQHFNMSHYKPADERDNKRAGLAVHNHLASHKTNRLQCIGDIKAAMNKAIVNYDC